MFEVILTNMGYSIYEGPCRVSAIGKATLSGFEATVLKDGQYFASYSPISGWKA